MHTKVATYVVSLCLRCCMSHGNLYVTRFNVIVFYGINSLTWFKISQTSLLMPETMWMGEARAAYNLQRHLIIVGPQYIGWLTVCSSVYRTERFACSIGEALDKRYNVSRNLDRKKKCPYDRTFLSLNTAVSKRLLLNKLQR